MKEIKFRGYDGAEWIYSMTIDYDKETDTYYMKNDNKEWIMVNKVAQYTNIDDMNRKEIYDGSLICELIDDVPDIGVVYFADGMYKVKFDNAEDFPLSGCDLDQTEVVGNIYDSKNNYEELYEFYFYEDLYLKREYGEM
ncbi:MAG: YopX family protein [Bacillaceae bacterium]